MRRISATLLAALWLVACDDSDDGEKTVDAGRADGGSVQDGGSPSDGGSALDAGSVLDAGNLLLDASTSSSDGGAVRASAALEARSGSSTTGSATFDRSNGLVTLTLTVSGALPGKHGAHLHAVGDCSAADASSAGGHWNPDMRPHGSGAPDAGASSHLGDLGNIVIGADGRGTLTLGHPAWTLGDGTSHDVLGKALVVHANEDDLVTQQNPDAGITPGNSGGRIACGVIKLP